MLEEHIPQLSALAERWRNLEERIKEAEQISGTVIIPAINELRYAGRRFFEAWLIAAKPNIGEEEAKEFEKHIIMAEQYFNNADHDLSDSLVMFFSERADQILLKYGLLRSTEMYPRIVEWIANIRNAQAIIRSSRGNRHNRMEEYRRLQTEHVPAMSVQYRDILFSEKLYSAKLKRETFFSRLGYISGLIGAIAAILSLWLEWDRLLRKISALFT